MVTLRERSMGSGRVVVAMMGLLVVFGALGEADGVLVWSGMGMDVVVRQTQQLMPGNLMHNTSFVIENLQAGPMTGPFMYNADTAQQQQPVDGSAVYAENTFLFNTDGSGAYDPSDFNQSQNCGLKGTGLVTSSRMTGLHLGLDKDTNEGSIAIALEFESFVLDESTFKHVNVVDMDGSPDTLGEKGDQRTYNAGVMVVRNTISSEILLRLTDVVMTVAVSYPQPVGPVEQAEQDDKIEMSVVLTAKLDADASDPEWAAGIDPKSTGVVHGFWDEATFESTGCWNVYRSVHLVLYDSSPYTDESAFIESDYNINTGKALGEVAKWTSVGVSLAGVGIATVSGVAGMATGTTSSVSAHAGVAKLVSTAAFVGLMNQIQDMQYPQSWREFAGRLDIFLLRVAAPWLELPPSEDGVPTRRIAAAGTAWASAAARQEVDSTIHEYIVIGCGFYSGVLLLALVVAQIGVFLILRKRSIRAQVSGRSYVNYITNAVLVFIFAASVLASVQYFAGGNKTPSLTAVAVLMLIIVGIGTIAFVGTVIFLAIKQLKSNELRYKYYDSISRSVRGKRNAGAMCALPNRDYFKLGAFRSSKDNMFHRLYGIFFDHFADIWIWLIGAVLVITLIEAAVTGAVGSTALAPIIVILVLECVFALVLLGTKPYSDIIEGVLEATVVCLEILLGLLALVINFEDDDESRASLGFAMVVIAFVALMLSVCVALWADIYPLSKQLVGHLKQVYVQSFRPEQFKRSDGDDEEWYSSDSEADEELAYRRELEDAVIQEIALQGENDVLDMSDVLDGEDDQDSGGRQESGSSPTGESGTGETNASAQRKASEKSVGFAAAATSSGMQRSKSNNTPDGYYGAVSTKKSSKGSMTALAAVLAGSNSNNDSGENMVDENFGDDDVQRVVTETSRGFPKRTETAQSAGSSVFAKRVETAPSASNKQPLAPAAQQVLLKSISEKNSRVEVSSQISGMKAGAEIIPLSQRKSLKELEAEAKQLQLQRSRSNKTGSSAGLTKKKSIGFFGANPT